MGAPPQPEAAGRHGIGGHHGTFQSVGRQRQEDAAPITHTRCHGGAFRRAFPNAGVSRHEGVGFAAIARHKAQHHDERERQRRNSAAEQIRELIRGHN